MFAGGGTGRFGEVFQTSLQRPYRKQQSMAFRNTAFKALLREITTNSYIRM